MFTGLIETTGHLNRFEPLSDNSKGMKVFIQAKLPKDIEIGQSIAVNGVCLTATELNAQGFSADISPETLERTALKTYSEGRPLNIEVPVQAQTYLGGHFVLGHVDGLGHIREIEIIDSFWKVQVDFPKELAPLMVEKGSITVDGVSLTINKLKDQCFELMLVPKTIEKTALSNLHMGDTVNLEVDIIGKYVLRSMNLMKEDA